MTVSVDRGAPATTVRQRAELVRIVAPDRPKRASRSRSRRSIAISRGVQVQVRNGLRVPIRLRQAAIAGPIMSFDALKQSQQSAEDARRLRAAGQRI